MNASEIILPAVAGGGLAAWGTFHPRSQIFGKVVRRAGSGCALTFDDGPNPQVTPRILALLEKHQIQATFFVLGKYVSQYPDLTSEIAARNHAIGNHTFGHRSLVFFSTRRIVDELNRCDEAVFQATGKRTECVRPPYGFRGPQFFRAAQRAGFSKIVMWSVNGRDWKPQSGHDMRRRLQKVRAGDIILLHDGDHRTSNSNRSHMLDALAFWLPRWKDAGLQFVKMA